MKKRYPLLLALPLAFTFSGPLLASTHGRVTDLNGAPLAQAMVVLTRAADASGPTAVTVFTNEKGEFAFSADAPPGTLRVRNLNYRQVVREVPTGNDRITILMRAEANQAGVAPASAYLKDVKNPASRESLVMACVACHQLPSPVTSPTISKPSRSASDCSHADAGVVTNSRAPSSANTPCAASTLSSL